MKKTIIALSVMLATNAYADKPINKPDDYVISGYEASDRELITTLTREYVKSNATEQDLEEALMDSGYYQNVKVQGAEVTVVENPKITAIKVKGGKSIPTSALEDNLKQFVNTAYNPKAVAMLENELRKAYTNLGKEEVQFKHELKENGELVWTVEEGRANKINQIKFIVNNQEYKSQKLKNRLSLNEKKSVFGLFHNTTLNQSLIASDILTIQKFFQNNGYTGAIVKDVRAVDIKPYNKDVIFIVETGEQYNFGKPEFRMTPELQTLLTNDKLEKFNTIKQGKQYHVDDVLTTKGNIESFLENNGFAFNKIKTDFETDGQNINVLFDISAGEQFVIDNISVSGNKKTKTDVILKEMRQQKGEIFDMSKMNRTRQRLMQTGYFSEADIISTPKEDGTVDVEVKVKERRTGTMQAQLGYMQNYGMSFGVGVEDKNAFGTGKTMGANVTYNKYSSNASFTYSDNHFKKDTSLDVDVYGSFYQPDTKTYKTQKYGVSAMFGLPVSEYNKIYVGGSIENLKLRVSDGAPKPYRDFVNNNSDDDKTKFSGVVAKAKVGWGINKTNNYYWPSSGYKANVNGEITIPGSKLNYYKFNAGYSHFFSIGDRASLMLSIKGGYGNSFGKTKNRTNGGLPFFENYYGGGYSQAIVRGLDNGSLGPKIYDNYGDKVSYGGNKMISASAELFSAVPFAKTDDVRLSAFIDAGSVWDGKTYSGAQSNNGKNVYDGLHRSTFGKELRYSVGVGFNWNSPIGPIKLSYAHPINKKKTDEVQKIQFQLGMPF